MIGSSHVLARLGRVGRPPRWRRFLAVSCRTFDRGVMLLPVAAILLRATVAPRLASWEWVALLTVAIGAMALLIGATVAVVGRTDPLSAAASLDRHPGAADRFSACVFALRGRHSSPLVPVLVDQVTRRLDTMAPGRSDEPIRWPAWTRIAAAVILAWLLLILPGLGQGLLSPAVDGETGFEATDSPGGETRGEATAEPPRLQDRIRLDAACDRAVYALGEEIELTVQVVAKQDAPSATPLASRLTVDGDVEIALPVELVVRAAAGEADRVTLPLKRMLETRGLYEPGLITLQVDVAARDTGNAPVGRATAEPITIQIDLNPKKKPTPRPQPTARRKTPRQPKKGARKPPSRQRPNPKKRPRPKRKSGGRLP